MYCPRLRKGRKKVDGTLTVTQLEKVGEGWKLYLGCTTTHSPRAEKVGGAGVRYLSHEPVYETESPMSVHIMLVIIFLQVVDVY